MHRRFQGVSALAIGISALTMAGCGSSTSTAAGSGVGTAVTTSGPAGTSSPAVASSPTGGSSATSGSGMDRTPSCAGLDAKVVQLHGAAMGSTYANIVVINRGKTVCTLPASPQLAFADADHKPLTVQVETSAAAKPFQLAVGASAAMLLRYGSDYNPPCHGHLAYIRVTPPGVEVPYNNAQNCEHGSASENVWVAGSYVAPS